MASPDLTLIADIDFRKGSQKLNRQLRGIEKRGVNIDTRKSSQALGRITGKADEFTKSLEASNARVIAFGASVAVIEGVRRSFVKLVDTIVQVEAQLTAINSILGRTSGNLQKFGNELFTIAKQTGQAFDLVATTAQEFARQGLSVEQTLKRTKDALILQRLTTLKSEESVASITAALNAFDKQALTSTQVINKLRAVETSFAVSSGDLADALARSASVAQDAGVSFDELLGVITAIKQRTGLGGATIGQGLKTVFTRLNLPTRIEQLRELGVVIDESAGGLEKLRQVSIAVGKAQEQGNVSLATQIGAIAAGQFQISKLSAAFSDLSSQYSVTDAAALKSASATNEAILANEQYNETIKSLANSVNQNIGQVLTKIGELGGQDAIKNIVKDVNALLEAVQGNKAKAGSAFVEIIAAAIRGANEFGFLADAAKGFINALTGPGLVAAASILSNLFVNTLTQGGKSLLTLTGINNRAQRRAELQKGINNLISQGTVAEQQQFNAAKNVAAQQQIILGILQRQVAAQNALMASPIIGAIGGRTTGRMGFGKQVRGFGQSMANGRLDPINQEQKAISKGVGGARPNAQVKVLPKFNYGSGKVGPAVVNTDEVVIPSKKGDVVLNRDMMRGAESFATGKVNLSFQEIAAAEKRLEAGRDLTTRQISRIARADVQGQGAAIPTFLRNYVRSESARIEKRRISTPFQDERFQTQKRAERVAVDRARKANKQAIVPAGGFFKGGKTGFVSSGPRLALPGEVAKPLLNRNQGVLSREEFSRRELTEPLTRPVKESVSSPANTRDITNSFGNRNRKIQAQFQDQILNNARITLEKESKKGLGRIGLGTRNKIAETKALATKGLLDSSKKELQREIGERRIARGQAITQKAFLASIAGSFLAPAIGTGVSGITGNERAGRGATGLVSGAASGVALGALAGPKGALIGGAIGGVVGLINSLRDTEDVAEKFTKKIQDLDEGFADARNNVSRYLQVQSQLNDLLETNKGDTPQAELLRLDLKDILDRLPENIKDAIESAKPKDISSVATKALVEEKNVIEQTKKRAAFESAIVTKERTGSIGIGLGGITTSKTTSTSLDQNALSKIISDNLQIDLSKLSSKNLPTVTKNLREEISGLNSNQKINKAIEVGERFGFSREDLPEKITPEFADSFLENIRKSLLTPSSQKEFLSQGGTSFGRGSFSLSSNVTPETIKQVTSPLTSNPSFRQTLKDVQTSKRENPEFAALLDAVTGQTSVQKEVKTLLEKMSGEPEQITKGLDSRNFPFQESEEKGPRATTEAVIKFLVEGRIGGEQQVKDIEDLKNKTNQIFDELGNIKRNMNGKTPLPPQGLSNRTF